VSPGGIVQVGTLVVPDVPARTEVYVDGSLKGVIPAGGMRIGVVPGTHNRLLSPDKAANPGAILVTLVSGHDTTLAPLFIAMHPDATKLSGADAKAAAVAVRAFTLPTKAKPLALAGGCALVYASDNRIIAEGTTNARLYGACLPMRERRRERMLAYGNLRAYRHAPLRCHTARTR